MAGGFPFHKWISNESKILAAIPSEKQINSAAVIIEENQQIHVLGLIWNPNIDAFNFEIASLQSGDKTIYSFNNCKDV